MNQNQIKNHNYIDPQYQSIDTDLYRLTLTFIGPIVSTPSPGNAFCLKCPHFSAINESLHPVPQWERG